MQPGLALDPALLAIPAISNDEEQIASAIKIISEIAKEFRGQSDCRIYLISDACDYLAAANLYPTADSIAEMLGRHNLLHVYTPEDIRRAINEVLARASHLEDLSGITFMIPVSVASVPTLCNLRTGPLNEALELTALHTGFVGRATHPKMVQMLIADNLKSQQIDITADIEGIDPPIEPGAETEFTAINLSIWSTESIDLFLLNLPPDVVWQNADESVAIALAIKLAAFQVGRESGCTAPKDNCERFSIGVSFFETLDSWEATSVGRNANSTLDMCARIVARLPKSEINRLVKNTGAKNKTEDVTRPSDGAEAWRTHITKHHEGVRLMFWRRLDGSVEFANIGSKSEVEIL